MNFRSTPRISRDIADFGGNNSLTQLPSQRIVSYRNEWRQTRIVTQRQRCNPPRWFAVRFSRGLRTRTAVARLP